MTGQRIEVSDVHVAVKFGVAAQVGRTVAVYGSCPREPLRDIYCVNSVVVNQVQPVGVPRNGNASY